MYLLIRIGSTGDNIILCLVDSGIEFFHCVRGKPGVYSIRCHRLIYLCLGRFVFQVGIFLF